MDEFNMEEISLVYLLLQKEFYNKYIYYLNKINLEIETKNMLKALDSYYKENESATNISVEEFLMYFNVKHPVLKKRSSYQVFLSRLEQANFNSKIIEENMNKFLERYVISEMFLPITEVLDGDRYDVIDELQSYLDKYTELKVHLGKTEDELFVTEDLEQLLEATSNDKGLKWRLSCLNEDLGTLHGGSLGHVFARVDTGKTSFLASEVSNFASQLEDDQVILWFNNEEEGKKVKKRLYQAALDCTSADLANHTKSAQEQFDTLGGNKVKIIDEAELTIEYIDSIINMYNVALVVIDQGDKVSFSGSGKHTEVARLKALYGKFRQISKTYNVPVLTVGQASVDAFGEKWLELAHMDNSKTGKPGELDYAIGIGKWIEDIDANIDSLRYISLCKNKMNNGVHGRHATRFNSMTARYSDPSAVKLKQ